MRLGTKFFENSERPWIWSVDHLKSKHLIFNAPFEVLSEVTTRMVRNILNMDKIANINFTMIDPESLGSVFRDTMIPIRKFVEKFDPPLKSVTIEILCENREIEDKLRETQNYIKERTQQSNGDNTCRSFIFIHRLDLIFTMRTRTLLEDLEQILKYGVPHGVRVIATTTTDNLINTNDFPQFKQYFEHFAAPIESEKSANINFAHTNGKKLSFTMENFSTIADINTVLGNRYEQEKEGIEKGKKQNSFEILLEGWEKENEKNMSERSSSSEYMAVPLGWNDEREIIEMEIGNVDKVSHHALIEGSTGTGKSNLLHVLIRMAAEIYTPEELEMYLVDFKQGVELGLYHQLPHARVIVLEADIEYARNVLNHIVKLTEDRNKKFEGRHVNNFTAYRKRGNKMPRTLLIMDEVQALFKNDATRARIESLSKSGRSAGIHLILASQDFQTVHKSIKEQFNVNIALGRGRGVGRATYPHAQASEDRPPTFHEDRPPTFQCAYIEDQEEEDQEEKEKGWMPGSMNPNENKENNTPRPRPRLFKGKEAAGWGDFVALAKNPQSLKTEGKNDENEIKLWLGERVAVNPENAIMLSSATRNILIAEDDMQPALGIVIGSLLSLAVQGNSPRIVFRLVNFYPDNEQWKSFVEEFKKLNKHDEFVFDYDYNRRDTDNNCKGLNEALDCVSERLSKDNQAREGREILILFGVHYYQKEEETRKKIENILTKGPKCGIHTIIWDNATRDSFLGDNCSYYHMHTYNFFSFYVLGSGSESLAKQVFGIYGVRKEQIGENRMVFYDKNKKSITIRPYAVDLVRPDAVDLDRDNKDRDNKKVYVTDVIEEILAKSRRAH